MGVLRCGWYADCDGPFNRFDPPQGTSLGFDKPAAHQTLNIAQKFFRHFSGSWTAKQWSSSLRPERSSPAIELVMALYFNQFIVQADD